ncbi:MAG: hypothetical protein NTV36_03350 [Candidatus Staskawiczbacteria bacterium]|nr:hypothetical protein [Candidatus Staskawiczbacteria bacterium]
MLIKYNYKRSINRKINLQNSKSKKHIINSLKMNKTKKIVSVVAITMALLPLLAFAYTAPVEPTGGLTSIGTLVTNVLGLIWPAFIGLAVIMIIVAGLLFITSNGAPEKISQARMSLLWAIVGIVVAILAYSLPAIIKTAIGG